METLVYPDSLNKLNQLLIKQEIEALSYTIK